MSTNAANLDVGYPIYGTRFINNKMLVVVGGGGEGNNGIANKITVIRISFKQKDAKRRLQRFREITLPANEDLPMCVDVARAGADALLVFVGCNQSMQLIKSMNINNNLRKYVFTSEEHLRFLDAAQLEPELADNVGEYPKVVSLAPDNSVGALMTSRVPSVIYVFSPDLLELNARFTAAGEIRDFTLNPFDNGKSLCYVSGSAIETISTSSTESLTSSTKNEAAAKSLQRYIFTKVKYVSETDVVLAANLRNGKGVVVLKYSLTSQRIVSVKEISSKIKGLVAMDVSVDRNLVALAGNDFSLTLVRLSDFKVLKTFKKLHPFAITCVAFSPNGSKLATGSASNAVHVLDIPANFSKGSSTIGTLFRYLLLTIFIGVLGVVLQIGYENGQLQEYLELSSGHLQEYLELSSVQLKKAYEVSSLYSKIAYHQAYEYSVVGYEFLKDKLKQEKLDGDDETRQYFTMSEWLDSNTIVNSASTSIETTRSTDTARYAETPRDENSVDSDDIINESTGSSQEYTLSQIAPEEAVPEPEPESLPSTEQKVASESPAQPQPESFAQAAQAEQVPLSESVEADDGYEAEDESEVNLASQEPIIERGYEEVHIDLSVSLEVTSVVDDQPVTSQVTPEEPAVESVVEEAVVEEPPVVEEPLVEPPVVEDPIKIEEPVSISEAASEELVAVESDSASADSIDEDQHSESGTIENTPNSELSLLEPSESRIETESETESESESGFESGSEADSDSGSEADSETETEVESETETESETESETEVESETETEIAETEAAVAPESKAEFETKIEVEPKSEIKVEAEEVQSVQSDTQANAELPVIEEASDSESIVDDASAIEDSSVLESSQESVTEVSLVMEEYESTSEQSASESRSESSSESSSESESESEYESEYESESGSSSESGIESDAESTTEVESETEAESEIDSGTEVESATEVESETEIDSETEIESATEIESDTESESETQIETTQSNSDTETESTSSLQTDSATDSEYTLDSSSETETETLTNSQAENTKRKSTKLKKKKKKAKKTKSVNHDEL